MPVWDSLKNTVAEEISLREQQGCSVGELRKEFEAAGEDETALRAVYGKLTALKPSADFPYIEPDGYEEIMKDSRFSDSVLMDGDLLYDKMYGGWLGRCIGCNLGKPLERDPFVCGDEKRHGWEHVRKYFEGAGAYPIDGYVPEFSEYTKECGRAISHPICRNSTRENVRFADGDDDIRYSIIGMLLFEKKGYDFRTLDVVTEWTARLTARQICTAEEQAYINFCLTFPSVCTPDYEQFDAKLPEIREKDNPYREYLGARIRVDGYSMCAPNMPVAATKMAYQDAILSHERNGVYSAIYASALISLAYAEKDVRTLVRKAMTAVPARSRLYEAISYAFELVDRYDDFCDIAEAIWRKYEKCSWIHSLNNDCLLTAALLYSQGDFEKGITNAVLGGLDTDCNGATVGCILGVLNGAEKIPEKWKAPLHDTIVTEMCGVGTIAISECAERCFAAVCGRNPSIRTGKGCKND